MFVGVKNTDADISPVIDDHSITMMATSLNVAVSNPWYTYNSGDAPEGAYMGWLLTGTNTITTTIVLPQALTPGRYYIFLKGISYDNNVSVKTTIGGVDSTSVVADDRDITRYWTDRMVIDVGTASSSLVLSVMRNQSVLVGDQKLLLKGLYITSDSLESVNRDDVVLQLVYPTVMDDSAAVPGNLVVNSGFETGIDAGWGFDESKNHPINTTLDTTVSHSGQNSLKLPIATSTNVYGAHTTVYSKVYHLKPNKKYTYSMWMKTNPGKTVTIAIKLINTFVPPDGYPAQYDINTYSTFDENWQRISVTGYALEYVTSDYQMMITMNGATSTYVYIDDIQLEEGDLTTYQPSSNLEAGIAINNIPGNLFYTDDTLNGTIDA
jgi:hypothetical protein